MFGDVLSKLSSLSASAGGKVFGAEGMTIVVMTVVDFQLWTFSKGRSNIPNGPVRFRCILVHRGWPGDN